MKACNYVLINNSKLLTVFRVIFKRTNQIYLLSKINQSINIKWCTCDKEVTNISTTLHKYLKITKMQLNQQKLWSFEKTRKRFKWKQKKICMDSENIWVLLNTVADQIRHRTENLCVVWLSTKWPWNVKVMLC